MEKLCILFIGLLLSTSLISQPHNNTKGWSTQDVRSGEMANANVFDKSEPVFKANKQNSAAFGTDRSLEIVSWNIEFFPHNGDVTIGSLSRMIVDLDADIIAFQEVADVNAFTQMINETDGYHSYVGTTDDLIKLGFVYKAGVIQVNNVYEIYKDAQYDLPFLRRPLVMEFTYNNENYVVINNHFKARGDGILDLADPNDEENRRWVATNLIKDYIDTHFANEKVFVVGDLNDVITDDYANNVFQSILNDSDNFMFADYDIATGADSEWSYPSYPSHIDHIIITNELFNHYYTYSASVATLKMEESLTGGWNEYTQNISDHRPVGIKLFTDDVALFRKDFEDQSLTSGGWSSYNVTGNQNWTIPQQQYGVGNSYCAYISGYDNGQHENENWLISPPFSTDAYNDLILSFWNTSGYAGPDIQLLYSNDFSDNPETATWQEINPVVWHDGDTYWEWTYSGPLNLSSFSGAEGRIAFKYTSTSTEAATWELDNIMLSNAPNVLDIVAEVNDSQGGSISGTGAYIYGQTVELEATPAPSFNFVNWTENGEVVSANPFYSFIASEDRALVAHFEAPVSVNETASDFKLKVYPNPFNRLIFVEGQNIRNIEVLNVRGKIMKEIEVVSNPETIHLEELPAGIYFIRITTDDGSFTTKLLKI
ncbi:T9SS-dependent choice-of-anchor J family protein [Marinilabilia rubra]|uniref:Endonuclease n=1 Tax=Marinilabilia rubra TaxID=2162893 RepID=A0A2U2B7B9_9BACT|nr:choice-of-anchor J domain-containing protein [Marinilabilia rubra]PWD98934.1 hypothetical protein DDZ16_13135 [Marinilabilia rubra]